MERLSSAVWFCKMSDVNPLRVVFKALVFYLISNLLFVYFEPAIGKLSIYNWLVPGRLRVPYEREAEYYPVSHIVPVYEDMDAMFQSHVISQPKAKDEFRVALVGDSAAWAFGLHPQDMLAAQLTALNLTTCDGKRVTAYNTAFPLPYVMKDVLIMDKVREYDPDMFIWMITLDAFRNRTIYTDYFLNPYADHVFSLIDKYRLNNLDVKKLESPAFWDKTIVGQRSRIKRIFLLQIHGLAWKATGVDHYYYSYEPLSNDQSDSLLFDVYKPGKLDLDELLFDVLGAGYGVAGDVPLLVVNEPIFIATGANSDIRYDEFYPRWAYDHYLEYLSGWMNTNQHEYLDLWNAIPSAEFTDTPFHRSPEGEKMLADLLAPKLLEMACASQEGNGIEE